MNGPRTRSVSECRGWLLLLVAATIAGPAAATEINVEDSRWNLDNLLRGSRFNQLVLDVANVSGTEFDGNLRYVVDGTAIGGGLVLVQPLYLAADQKKRVVFDVPVQGQYLDDGRVEWGRSRDQRLMIKPPGFAGGEYTTEGQPVGDVPPVVWISAELSGTSVRGVQRLQERFFPTSAVSLPGDGVLALDHDPAWQPAQRQTFADWLQLGGRVLIFEPTSGDTTFTGEMEFLNRLADAGEGWPVGLGRVYRPSQRPQDLTPEDWATLSKELATPATTLTGYYGEDVYDAFAEGTYSAFSQVHRPVINWLLVFVLFVMYIVGIVGGGLFTARKTRNWKAIYGLLAALIIGFSLLFWQIGQRGHGEQSRALTVATVDVLDAETGRSRVEGWTQFFTTGSDQYAFRPTDARTAFQPREVDSTVLVLSGPDAALVRRVAGYAASSFRWQSIVDGLELPHITSLRRLPDDRVQVTLSAPLPADADSALFWNGMRARGVSGETTFNANFNIGRREGIQLDDLNYYRYRNYGRSQKDLDRDRVASEMLETRSDTLQTVTETAPGTWAAGGTADAMVLLMTLPLPESLQTPYSDGAAHEGRIVVRTVALLDGDAE